MPSAVASRWAGPPRPPPQRPPPPLPPQPLPPLPLPFMCQPSQPQPSPPPSPPPIIIMVIMWWWCILPFMPLPLPLPLPLPPQPWPWWWPWWWPQPHSPSPQPSSVGGAGAASDGASSSASLDSASLLKSGRPVGMPRTACQRGPCTCAEGSWTWILLEVTCSTVRRSGAFGVGRNWSAVVRSSWLPRMHMSPSSSVYMTVDSTSEPSATPNSLLAISLTLAARASKDAPMPAHARVNRWKWPEAPALTLTFSFMVSDILWVGFFFWCSAGGCFGFFGFFGHSSSGLNSSFSRGDQVLLSQSSL